MRHSLSDLESLALTCKSDQSREYISEAIRCYGAAAYRAAIVNTWIAVVYDLIEKIRELSLTGDEVAKSINAEHERYIRQIEQKNSDGLKGALEFERLIIEVCRDKLQFFDAQQFLDLDRLRQDRHRCAHPSFQRLSVPYDPPAEQARLHIRNAVVHVLSQPPVQGKAALNKLKELVSSEYFPLNKKDAILQLKHVGINSLTDPAINGFVDMLVYSFLDGNDRLFYKGTVYSAMEAVLEIFPVQVEARLRKQFNKLLHSVPENVTCGACALVSHTDFSWGLLDDAVKDWVASFVKKGPTSQVLPLLPHFSSRAGLEPVVKRRIETMSLPDLRAAVSEHGLRSAAKDRSLHFLSKSGTWDSTNQIFNDLIFPIYDALTKDDVIRIMKMPSENKSDLIGAHAYSVFLNKIKSSGLFEDKEFRALVEEQNSSFLLRDLGFD